MLELDAEDKVAIMCFMLSFQLAFGQCNPASWQCAQEQKVDCRLSWLQRKLS